MDFAGVKSGISPKQSCVVPNCILDASRYIFSVRTWILERLTNDPLVERVVTKVAICFCVKSEECVVFIMICDGRNGTVISECNRKI